MKAKEAGERLRASAERALAEHGCPSLSLAVAHRGEVVFAEAFGLADPANGRAATPGTVYGLASVTKPITATAVCLAADEGLLDLDAPVPGEFGGYGGYVAQARGSWPSGAAAEGPGPLGDRPRNAWPRPTARQLLQHRGGLAAYYDWHYGDGRPTPDADRHAVPHRAPGTAFDYANLGYRVLGRLLADATGASLESFVRERVFAPLGLDACRIARTHPGPGPAAVRLTADGRAYPDYGCSHPGATLGWATAGELALFAQSFARLLAPATAAAALDPLPVNDRLGYGLGWCVSTGAGPRVISHGGGGPGVAAMLVAVPERDLSVAVLTNTTSKAARDTVVREVLTALVPGYREESVSPAVPDPARPLAPEGRWTGRIATPERDVPLVLRVLPDRSVEVTIEGDAATAPASASRLWDLRADLPLQLPTADARINSPRLALTLRRSADGSLTGAAHAHKDGDATGFLGNFLTHPCALSA